MITPEKVSPGQPIVDANSDINQVHSNTAITFIKEILWSFILGLIPALLLTIWYLFTYKNGDEISSSFLRVFIIILTSSVVVIYIIRSILGKKTNILRQDIKIKQDPLPKLPYNEENYRSRIRSTRRKIVIYEAIAFGILVISLLFNNSFKLPLLIIAASIALLSNFILLSKLYMDIVDKHLGYLGYFLAVYHKIVGSIFAILWFTILFTNFFTVKLQPVYVISLIIILVVLIGQFLFYYSTAYLKNLLSKEKPIAFIGASIYLFWTIVIFVLVRFGLIHILGN